MKGAGLFRLAWFLAGLLALSAILFTLSEPDTSEKPVSDSYEPGGAAAFAELLRLDGYKVEIAKTIPLSNEIDSIPIAFLDLSTASLEPAKKKPTPSSEDDANSATDSEDDLPPAQQYLRTYLATGQPAILLAYNEAVKLEPTLPESTLNVRDVDNRTYTLVSPNVGTSPPPELAGASASFAPASAVGLPGSLGLPIYDLELVHGGTTAYIASGEIAMNSFIDRKDNAKFLLDAIHSIAPSGSKLLFLDPTVTGGGEPGVLDVIGVWSKGALFQSFLVFIVVVFSLGKRFGLADETRRRQAGARDLLEGISNTYTRARAGKAALGTILESQDRRVRKFLKLPVDSPKRKRNDVLPASLVNAFRWAEHLEIQDPTPDQALHAVRGLESEVNALIGPPRTTRVSRHRVKSR